MRIKLHKIIIFKSRYFPIKMNFILTVKVNQEVGIQKQEIQKLIKSYKDTEIKSQKLKRN